MALPTLKVSDVLVETQKHPDYTFRFVIEEGKSKPVLYYKGKRVTQSWEIRIDHQEPKDLNGSSA